MIERFNKLTDGKGKIIEIKAVDPKLIKSKSDLYHILLDINTDAIRDCDVELMYLLAQDPDIRELMRRKK